MNSFLLCLVAILVSFLAHHFWLGSQGRHLDLFTAFAFGLGWGMAHFVDQPKWSLPKKLGISFVGILAIIVLGILFFDFETSVPAVIRFSVVFVAYYLIASFKNSKSLRQ